MKYPFLRPVLPPPDKWVPLLESSYDSRYFSNFGNLSSQFEARLAKSYFAKDYQATVVTSNTLGQQAVLQSLEVKDKYVILPDFTFAATLQAVIAAGGKPLICDVSPDTGELCPDSLRKTLAAYDDVKAVIHVRCYGFVQDISEIREICRINDIQLIVDAAAALADPADQSFGSADGEIEIFSLHATKVFAIGEGGVIAAPKEKMARIRQSVNFGFMPDRTYFDGTNAKLDEFRSAIGLCMMDMMPDLVGQRQRHAALYQDLLRKYDNVRFLPYPSGPSWSCFPVKLSGARPPNTVEIFNEAGVDIKTFYGPGCMRGYIGQTLLTTLGVTASEQLQEKIICLPVYSDLIDETWPGLAKAVETAFRALEKA